MIKVLFFPGKNTPLKRYKSYFPTFDLTQFYDVSNPPKIIMCHSAGIHDALLWVRTHSSKLCIVCMDPQKISPDDLPITVPLYLFRKQKTYDEEDTKFYSAHVHYSIDTHYPYQVKSIRNAIVNTIMKLIDM
jgi:hypothetical protein